MNLIKPMHDAPKYANFEELKILPTWQTGIHGQRVKILKAKFYAEPMHGHETTATWFSVS